MILLSCGYKGRYVQSIPLRSHSLVYLEEEIMQARPSLRMRPVSQPSSQSTGGSQTRLAVYFTGVLQLFKLIIVCTWEKMFSICPIDFWSLWVAGHVPRPLKSNLTFANNSQCLQCSHRAGAISWCSAPSYPDSVPLSVGP